MTASPRNIYAPIASRQTLETAKKTLDFTDPNADSQPGQVYETGILEDIFFASTYGSTSPSA
jgi:hypothetical protein